MTTVFSLGDDQADAFALRDEQAAAPPGRARVFVAGPIVFTDTADAARAETDKVIALKPDLLKIRVDDNLGTSKKMPEAAWRATLERAKAAELTLAAHIFYLSDAKALAEAGNIFIAHSVRDLPVDDAFLTAMKAANACYSPTLMREVSTFVYDSTPPWTERPVLPPRLRRRTSPPNSPTRHARPASRPARRGRRARSTRPDSRWRRPTSSACTTPASASRSAPTPARRRASRASSSISNWR